MKWACNRREAPVALAVATTVFNHHRRLYRFVMLYSSYGALLLPSRDYAGGRIAKQTKTERRNRALEWSQTDRQPLSCSSRFAR
jgi:hypothetical protein